MLFVYDLGIKIYAALITAASSFNRKAKLWTEGRKNIFSEFPDTYTNDKAFWFHFASLGEFEQGRPVLEKLKKIYPGKRIVITFFSPSGYEIRKNYPLADQVLYLPLDTAENAQKLIKKINPDMAVFTKYEYWYHYFEELYRQEIPLYMISCIFRKNQPFFRWYGSLHREMLSRVSHFFVQDEQSKALLETINIKNVTVSGDTRFDRVLEHSKDTKKLPLVEDFCGSSPVFIAGSTWPEDEKLLAPLAAAYPEWKFIIAPHEISANKIQSLENLFQNRCIKYSELAYSRKSEAEDQTSNIRHRTSGLEPQILIIDNIGMLSSLYQYGHAAYIGGGFGAGIHNTLEAAAFGLPVIFGPNYQRFREARDLIKIGAANTVKNYKELEAHVKRLQHEDYRQTCSSLAADYVKGGAGAASAVIHYIITHLGGYHAGNIQ